MNKFACRYAVIRFLPYPETEEFANIGIVLACPEIGYFDFKLQTRRYGRVTNFFDEVDAKNYREAVSLFAVELSRIKEVISVQSPEVFRQMFSNLIHPREAIVQFGQSRSRLSDKPSDTLDQLFRYYVEREFVNHEYKEQVLERRIRFLVTGLHLENPFKELTLGDDFTSARFPLVQSKSGQPTKAIKPFYLNQEDPSKIISHGGLWVDRIKRLRKRHLLPSEVMFAVDGPKDTQSKRYLAYQEICEDLRSYEIQITSTDHTEDIIKFATDI